MTHNLDDKLDSFSGEITRAEEKPPSRTFRYMGLAGLYGSTVCIFTHLDLGDIETASQFAYHAGFGGIAGAVIGYIAKQVVDRYGSNTR